MLSRRAGGLSLRWKMLHLALLGFQVLLALGLSGALGMGIGVFVGVAKSLPTDPNLAEFTPKAATCIFASGGELLGKVWTEKREPVPIAQIPKNLQEAVVAVEDKRFFRHHGIDFHGILRAAKANLSKGRMVEGASTITQQLARDLYLTRRRTVTRKIQEAILALEIERRYSKQEILELYLNQVNFGHGAYGANSAARVYFGKDLKDLSLGECALLGGLPQRPATNSPYVNPQVARARRDLVLRRMWEQGYITEAQSKTVQQEKIQLVGEKPSLWEKLQAPYFTSYVVQELIERYGERRVYEGGLRVFTTIQMPVQREAEKAVEANAPRLKRLRASQTALVAIHPQTGHIIAMVGGVDYSQSEYNRATQARRQPGSAFKPFVYATAIGQGMLPSSVISGQAQNIGGWVCKNWDGAQYGSVTLARGLARSINTATVNLQERVGRENVIRTARAMGIKSRLLPVASLAIGANVVPLLELVGAYGGFMTDGIRYEPMAVVRVEDYRGRVIDRFAPQPKRALTAKTAQVVRGMLQGVISGGTGGGARGVDPQAGGKTGTTSDNKDVWFIGFVPGLLAGVWAGNDDNSPTSGLVGSTGCVPTWKAFMLGALKVFEPPRTVAAAVGEEGAVSYEPPPKAKKRQPSSVSGEGKMPVASPSPAESSPPRKASTGPAKGSLETGGSPETFTPAGGGAKGKYSGPSGEGSSGSHSKGSTKAAE